MCRWEFVGKGRKDEFNFLLQNAAAVKSQFAAEEFTDLSGWCKFGLHQSYLLIASDKKNL